MTAEPTNPQGLDHAINFTSGFKCGADRDVTVEIVLSYTSEIYMRLGAAQT